MAGDERDARLLAEIAHDDFREEGSAFHPDPELVAQSREPYRESQINR